MEQEQYSRSGRKWKQIRIQERYKIEGYLKEKRSAREIAELLGYSKRTIEREIRLGLTEQMKPASKDIISKGEVQIRLEYVAESAQRRHDENGQNKGPGLKIGKDHKLAGFIEEKIGKEHWSPEAVIGYIREKGLEFETKICAKTVYNYIDKDLFVNISNKDLLYKKAAPKKKQKRIHTTSLNNRNGKSIDERPEEINRREGYGHWEIDLVVGKAGTKPAILTLVERKSRKSIYILIRDKTQKQVLKALRKAQRRTKGDFTNVFRTITADNGPEFLDGKGIKESTGCEEVYYAHPYSSWERGSNENGNRMLRRFLPKKTDFGTLSAAALQRIEDWVNNYPRKIFGFKSANDIYYSAV